MLEKKLDKKGRIEYDKLSIYKKTKSGSKGKHLYTINFYRTTCTILVNGASYTKFLSDDYPLVEKFVNERYNHDLESKMKLHFLMPSHNEA